MVDMVNQQTEIGLLMAMPPLIGTLAFSPWVIYVFYTPEFEPATTLLQWFTFGCLGRVMSWPMGFVMLAKGRALLFAGVETFLNLAHLLFIWFGLAWFGLDGVAIAFLGLYLVAIVVDYIAAQKLIGFSWSPNARKLLSMSAITITFTFLEVRFLPTLPATLLGFVVSTACSLYCLKELTRCVGPSHRLSRILFRIPGVRRYLGNP
jgi:PST family polysaccharide transporter